MSLPDDNTRIFNLDFVHSLDVVLRGFGWRVARPAACPSDFGFLLVVTQRFCFLLYTQATIRNYVDGGISTNRLRVDRVSVSLSGFRVVVYSKLHWCKKSGNCKFFVTTVPAVTILSNVFVDTRINESKVLRGHGYL